MKDFTPVNWKEYNKPPFFPQWLCRDETLELARYDDKLLEDIDIQIRLIKDQNDIENVKGMLLDRIGKILSEPRQGNDDTFYRILLMLRRLLNTTNGSLNDIIKVIKFIYSSEVVHIVPDYPAGIIIEHDGEGTAGLNFNKIIAEVVPAGVNYATKEIFRFTEQIDIIDLGSTIRIHRNTKDNMRSNKLLYNGRALYGAGASGFVYGNGFYNADFLYNGVNDYNGLAKIEDTDPLQLPVLYQSEEDIIKFIFKKIFEDQEYVVFRYGSGHAYDGKLKYDNTITFGAGIHYYDGSMTYGSHNQPFFDTAFINTTEDINDNANINDLQGIQVKKDLEENFIHANAYDGKKAFNGAMRYKDNDGINDFESIALKLEPMEEDTVSIQEETDIFVRQDIHYDGKYKYFVSPYDGTFKYNGAMNYFNGGITYAGYKNYEQEVA